MVRIVDKDRLHATIVVDGHNFVEEVLLELCSMCI